MLRCESSAMRPVVVAWHACPPLGRPGTRGASSERRTLLHAGPGVSGAVGFSPPAGRLDDAEISDKQERYTMPLARVQPGEWLAHHRAVPLLCHLVRCVRACVRACVREYCMGVCLAHARRGPATQMTRQTNPSGTPSPRPAARLFAVNICRATKKRTDRQAQGTGTLREPAGRQARKPIPARKTRQKSDIGRSSSAHPTPVRGSSHDGACVPMLRGVVVAPA